MAKTLIKIRNKDSVTAELSQEIYEKVREETKDLPWLEWSQYLCEVGCNLISLGVTECWLQQDEEYANHITDKVVDSLYQMVQVRRSEFRGMKEFKEDSDGFSTAHDNTEPN